MPDPIAIFSSSRRDGNTGRLMDCIAAELGIEVVDLVTPAMKTFLDRISDYLDIPELKASGRQLRGKSAFIVCTSVVEQAPGAFVGALTDTFNYLGMRYGGIAHVNCEDGYDVSLHALEAARFSRLARSHV